MSQEFFISVVVCTYNRQDLLKLCIESLFNQSYPKDKYEIIIIDSGPTNGTEDIDIKLLNHSPCEFRYIYRDSIGLSAARNVGIVESKGNVIAFIDDDAEANEDWLKYLVEPYDEADVVCVGGKTIPKYESTPSKWFEKRFWGWVGLQDLGETRKTIEKGKLEEYPVGCNVSFRKEIFKKIGFFREDLGRIKGSLLSYEETEICDRILFSGYKIVYEPKGIVRHFIPKDRVSLMHFIKRYYFEGISEARVNTSFKKSIRISLRVLTYPIKFLIISDIHIFFSIFYSIGFIIESIRWRKI